MRGVLFDGLVRCCRCRRWGVSAAALVHTADVADAVADAAFVVYVVAALGLDAADVACVGVAVVTVAAVAGIVAVLDDVCRCPLLYFYMSQ